MKISTEFDSTAKIVGEEKAIEYIAKAGFDAWDFSMYTTCKFNWKTKSIIPNDHPFFGKDYLKYARRLKQVGLDSGIVCNQSHAPFPSDSPEVSSYFKRAIECTAEAGGEICIIHPANGWDAKQNGEMYLELLPFAKEHNVKIATENMWSWDWEKDQAKFAACATPESFNEHLDYVNDEFLTACLDIGHAEMKGSDTTAVEMIKALGKRLTSLHIHDNDKWHDSHQLPFTMNIDFEKIVDALREIDYKGYFTLEANEYMKNFNKDNAFDGVSKLYETGKKLADMFENKI